MTLSTLSLIAVTPAQAGTLTFNFEAFTPEEASLEVTFGSFLQGAPLGSVTVPDSLQVTAEAVTGSFTILDDPAQFTDNSIDLDTGFLNDVLLSSTYSTMLESLLGDFGLTSSQVALSADNLFDISEVSGNIDLESKDFTLPNNPSALNITYNNSANSIEIDGYSPEVVESCLSTTCLFDGNVSFGVNLVLGEFVTLTGDLLANSSVPLTPEASAAIANLQQMATVAQFVFGPTLDLATVEIENFSLTTNFVSADPTGSAFDAEITDGSITATATTDTGATEIFSQSLASAPVPVEPPAVVTEVLTIIEAEPPTVVTELLTIIEAEPPTVVTELPTIIEAELPVVVTELPTIIKTEPLAETVVELPAEKTPPGGIEKPAIVTEAHSTAVETPSLLTEVTPVVATFASTPTSTPGGSVTITTELISLVSTPLDDSDDTQDVPEPSILVGVLGAAALCKRGLTKTNAQ